METKSLEQEITNLSRARAQARGYVIENKKNLNAEEQRYYSIKSAYEKSVKIYMDLDRELALALNRQKQATLKPKTKAYNSTDQTIAKAIKQLSGLPKELRDKIIADLQAGLF